LAVWDWARGQPVGPYERGSFTGAGIMVGVGLYLKRRHPGGVDTEL